MKLHLDPRTKLFLILLCVLSAVFAPKLYFQFALVTLIGLLAVFSGAELNLSVFADIAVVGVGLLYILSRSAGKMLGASVGSRLMHCDPNVQKYLGITLLPQAGVALGMTVTVAEELGQSGTIIRSITLFAVLIYELVGPMLTKIALTKAGDIQPEGRTSSRGVMN